MPEIKEYELKEPGMIERVYEGFLVQPVPIVLAVLWLAGVALLGLCAQALYLFGLSLLSVAGM